MLPDHVDDRKLTAEQIPGGSNYFKPVLASERLRIIKDASGVSITDGTGGTANVIIANIKADNGMIPSSIRSCCPVRAQIATNAAR